MIKTKVDAIKKAAAALEAGATAVLLEVPSGFTSHLCCVSHLVSSGIKRNISLNSVSPHYDKCNLRTRTHVSPDFHVSEQGTGVLAISGERN